MTGLSFTRAERWRLAGFYAVVAALHLTGWGLYVAYSADHPSLIGLGLAAYLFGLRHAFDADHIAAIDDTARLLMQRGQMPLGAGFFFSLGHSSVVLALAVAITLAAGWVTATLPDLRGMGSLIGTGVSGLFLWIVGGLNLLVLLDILKLWRSTRHGAHSHAQLDDLLQRRGLLNRVLGGRARRVITRSWHLYPLGVLFGLGFDTATEVGMLAMTAGASVGSIPPAAVLSLPLLFAAGMTLMDTTDGVLMTRAYNWALLNPLRKIFYNLATTGLSVVVALVIGSIELAQVVIRLQGARGPWVDPIARLDFGVLGYVVAGVFLLGWAASVVAWKLRRVHATGGDRPEHPERGDARTLNCHEPDLHSPRFAAATQTPRP